MLRIRWSDEVKRAKEQVKSLARGGQDESPVGAVDRQGAGYLMPDDLNTSVHAAPWSPYQAGVSGERGLAGQGLELVDGPRLPKISEEFSRPPEEPPANGESSSSGETATRSCFLPPPSPPPMGTAPLIRCSSLGASAHVRPAQPPDIAELVPAVCPSAPQGGC
eukprot:gene140-5508_t